MITTWHHPPASPVAKSNAAHVWAVDLKRKTLCDQVLVETLSTAERERAEAVRVARDRARFVAARGSLRVILGKYAGCAPGELRFVTANTASPCWHRLGRNRIEIQFEPLGGPRAHRRFAVQKNWGRCRALQSRGQADETHCKTLFCPPRIRAVVRVAASRTATGFFSVLDAQRGISQSRGHRACPRIENGDVDLEDTPANWTLRHLDPGDGYVGAVAIAGKEIDVRCWMCETLVARSLSE